MNVTFHGDENRAVFAHTASTPRIETRVHAEIMRGQRLAIAVLGPELTRGTLWTLI
jgi:hypothetical protein